MKRAGGSIFRLSVLYSIEKGVDIKKKILRAKKSTFPEKNISHS